MYSASQLSMLFVSLVICILSIVFIDFLASFLPTSSLHLSETEQLQFYKSLLYRTRPSEIPHHTSESKKPIRLAFCCSADLDVSVRAVDLMKVLTQQQSPENLKNLVSQHYERIHSVSELFQSFSYYFSNGAAAEQSMSSFKEFHRIVALAKTLSNVQQSVGGNAATMAERAATEGCQVLLGAAIGKEMRKHYNPLIQIVGELSDEEQEDVHLVLEYGKEESFNGVTSPRANRYYLNHDIYNAKFSVLEVFEEALDEFQPDLVVIGGLQLMEVESDGEKRILRLKKVSKLLKNLYAKKTPSHYEFAAVSDFTLFDDTASLVLPWVNSIGLNEQELFILHEYLISDKETTATGSRPSVAQVTEQVHDILMYSKRAKKHFRLVEDVDTDVHSKKYALAQLGRIHFHTLQFHVLCQEDQSTWQDPTKALIQAALMSTKLACGKNRKERDGIQHSSKMEIDINRVEMLLPREILLSENSQVSKLSLDPFTPVLTWKEADSFQCYLVPMLACKQPDHTAGLGDNISGTGMAYHHQEQN